MGHTTCSALGWFGRQDALPPAVSVLMRRVRVKSGEANQARLVASAGVGVVQYSHLMFALIMQRCRTPPPMASW